VGIDVILGGSWRPPKFGPPKLVYELVNPTFVFPHTLKFQRFSEDGRIASIDQHSMLWRQLEELCEERFPRLGVAYVPWAAEASNGYRCVKFRKKEDALVIKLAFQD